MPLRHALAAMRVLACLLFLAAPVTATAGRAALPGQATPIPAALCLKAQEKDESCGRGKATKEFGWKVVEFGVSTLKYLIGLFIIPVGFFLVIIGALLQMVEAVVC